MLIDRTQDPCGSKGVYVGLGSEQCAFDKLTGNIGILYYVIDGGGWGDYS